MVRGMFWLMLLIISAKNGVFTLALFLLFCGIYGGFLIGE